eukprot:2258520-Rhodomonas_salina.1
MGADALSVRRERDTAQSFRRALAITDTGSFSTAAASLSRRASVRAAASFPFRLFDFRYVLAL